MHTLCAKIDCYVKNNMTLSFKRHLCTQEASLYCCFTEFHVQNARSRIFIWAWYPSWSTQITLLLSACLLLTPPHTPSLPTSSHIIYSIYRTAVGGYQQSGNFKRPYVDVKHDWWKSVCRIPFAWGCYAKCLPLSNAGVTASARLNAVPTLTPVIRLDCALSSTTTCGYSQLPFSHVHHSLRFHKFPMLVFQLFSLSRPRTSRACRLIVVPEAKTRIL